MDSGNAKDAILGLGKVQLRKLFWRNQRRRHLWAMQNWKVSCIRCDDTDPTTLRRWL